MAVNNRLLDALKQYWGFDQFLPLQAEAMQCVLAGSDSLVVMPTGGGKSVCYQAPAACGDGLAVVVSPLIALMKDQVDALAACGIAAAALNSSLAADDQRRTRRHIEAGTLRLLYVSPERLLAPTTLELLAMRPPSFFAIDEAHCVSAWGHDFRPEYRELRQVREHFPQAAVHAYTATATEAVRDDIRAQLDLRDPEVLVGDFRRLNLQYHVARRIAGWNQLIAVIDRYRGQSGIVYCITRAEVDRAAAALMEMGYRALPYHAGLTDEERTKNHQAFQSEQADVIVATVAFGMGIDKSNVRFVVHQGMPKSLEHYQQESGRAGRDGEPAECWLLYSARDLMAWRHVLKHTHHAAQAAAEASLQEIYNFCTSVECRHRRLVEHFGQAWTAIRCDACDVCLGDLELVAEPGILGQQILSCVLRVHEGFGADHVAKILTGSKGQKITSRRHDQLSTWGILKEHDRTDVRGWIEQLVSQGFLAKDREHYTLSVTDQGRRLLKGEVVAQLLAPTKQEQPQSSAKLLDSWEGVDRGLFDELRKLRSKEALNRSLPAYIVFSDATLRDMARRRPSSVERLLDVHGVGNKKAADHGERFVNCIVQYCRQHQVALDVATVEAPVAAPAQVYAAASVAFPLFDKGLSVDQVARKLDRARSTAHGYLSAYIAARRITDPTRWVDARQVEQIEVAAEFAGGQRPKPIYDALHGRVGYELIRITLACQANRRSS